MKRLANKSPVTDCTVKQDSPEDNNLFGVSNPGGLKSETKPPLPDVLINRRKMGSSRRMKQRQNVNGAESKFYQTFGEEVKEMTKSKAIFEAAQNEEHERIVRIWGAHKSSFLVTSGYQSGITSPPIKNEGEASEVDKEDCEEIKEQLGKQSVLDQSHNKRRLGSNLKNRGKHQVREADNVENCHSEVKPTSIPETKPEKLNQSFDYGVAQPPSHDNSMFSTEVYKNSMTNISETLFKLEGSHKLIEMDKYESTRREQVSGGQFENISGETNNNASAKNSQILIECDKPNADKNSLQDTILSEIKCKNNTFQIPPSELDNPINLQQKRPRTDVYPKTVLKKNVEKLPIKHLSGDKSSVSTMSSMDDLMLQAVKVNKSSGIGVNNGTYKSEPNFKKETNYAVCVDKDFKNIAKIEKDSTEATQNVDVHSGSHVGICKSPSSFTNGVKSVDSLDQELPQTEDTCPKTRNKRKPGSSRRNKGSGQVNISGVGRDNILIIAEKSEEVEITKSEELNSDGKCRLATNEKPKNVQVEENNYEYVEITQIHTEKDKSANMLSQSADLDKFLNPMQSFRASALRKESSIERSSSNNASDNLEASIVEVLVQEEACKAHSTKSLCDKDSAGQESSIQSTREFHMIASSQNLQCSRNYNDGLYDKHDDEKAKNEIPQSTLIAKNEHLTPAEDKLLKTNLITSVYDINDLQCSSTDLQITDCNLTPSTNDSKSFQPDQSDFPNEEMVNSGPVTQVVDVLDSERNRDVCAHKSQQPSFTNTELQITSEGSTFSAGQMDTKAPPGRGRSSINEIRTSHNENDREENLKVEQINKKAEKASNAEIEVQSSKSAKNRRKIGSRRRNLDFYVKGDKFLSKENENEAKETETPVKCATLDGVIGNETKGKEEGVSETVEHTLNAESYFNPMALQTCEENQGPMKDPLDLSPSPVSCTLSEQATVVRRKKLGSHRKSHRHHYNEDLSTASLVRSIQEEGEPTATEGHQGTERLGKIPKDDESYKTPLSNFTLTKNGANSTRIGKQTSMQPRKAGKEIQKILTLSRNPRDVESNSNHYNVVMIGDSSVGKTSFIKRAQSGKFSLDVPISVGLDSCKWTVMVDGKAVVLLVWDTAGQERFRSITRQLFHRAQAFLLMYDISSSQSFSAVTYWANCIQMGFWLDSADENVVILLLGNKCDRTERQVRTEQGETLAKVYNFAFKECSAASGENIIECLETVARMLSQMRDSKRDAPRVHNEGAQKKKSTCC